MMVNGDRPDYGRPGVLGHAKLGQVLDLVSVEFLNQLVGIQLQPHAWFPICNS
jgi:hypothetical protein